MLPLFCILCVSCACRSSFAGTVCRHDAVLHAYIFMQSMPRVLCSWVLPMLVSNDGCVHLCMLLLHWLQDFDDVKRKLSREGFQGV